MSKDNKLKKLEWSNETWKLANLIPASYNPRRISEEQKRELTESILEFEEVDPLIINRDGKIIGGHMRYQVYNEQGKKEVAVRVPSRQLTEAEEKKLNLRLNKNQGEWDWEKLNLFDETMLEEVGFESHELDRIFEKESLEDDFQAESQYQKIKTPKAKPGDIYQLGEHRVMCGSSTSEKDVKALMDGKEADMVFTDPPYNVAYKGRGKQTSEGIKNDDMAAEDFIEFSLAFFQRLKEALKEGGTYYVCSGYSSYVPFRYAIQAEGLYFAGPIIWVKNQASMGWNDYRHQQEMMLKGKGKKKKAEPIMYGWNGGRHYFEGDRTEADVWQIKRRASSTMSHPTQKPIELCARAIRNSSKRGEIVLDLFGGSGSTLIAAEKEGRKAYLMELDPKFVDIIIERWENYSGERSAKITNQKTKKQ